MLVKSIRLPRQGMAKNERSIQKAVYKCSSFWGKSNASIGQADFSTWFMISALR